LQGGRIYLDHHAVNLIFEFVAQRLDAIDEGDDFFDVRANGALRVDLKTVSVKPIKRGGVCREWLAAVGRDEVVGEHGEATARDDIRVKLTNRSGGGVARVGEARLVFLVALGVDALKDFA
jgi:hypothetical protein